MNNLQILKNFLKKSCIFDYDLDQKQKKNIFFLQEKSLLNLLMNCSNYGTAILQKRTLFLH